MSTKRVRRTPEVARAEILEAAEALLHDRDWSGVTVEAVMERTGMTRSSFYHYFKTVDDVAVALFDKVEAGISGAVDAWLESDVPGDPLESATRHLTRMYEVWSQNAALMRAMEQAAGRSGAAYDSWQGRVLDGYIEKTTRFIERQVALGRSDAADPAMLGRALILMNLSVATDQVLQAEPMSPERLAATVARVWFGAIWGSTELR